jgi:PAS domain S-box-containing protein
MLMQLEEEQYLPELQTEVLGRKQLETALLQSEERYEQLVQLSPDGIVVHRNGRIEFINRSGLEFVGATSETEVLGRSVLSLALPEYHALLKDRMARVQKGERLEAIEVRGARFDGAEAHCELLSVPFTHKGQPAVLAVIHDINKRKQAAEEQLQLQNERDELLEQLQLQMEFMPIALMLLDTEFRTTYWNPAAERIFGFTRQDVLGSCVHRFLATPEAQPYVEEICKRIIAGETSVSSFNDNITKDGRRIACDWHLAPLKKADGQIVGIMCMAQDVTDRRNADLTLRKSEERYRAFVEHSSEAVWCVNIEPPCPLSLSTDDQIKHIYEHGYLAECNDVMAQMFGFSKAAELFGLRMGTLLPRSKPENLEYLKTFIESGYRLADADTQERDRAFNLKCFLNNLVGTIENGAMVRAWGTKRDITKRKEAENALLDSEERYQRLVELSPDAIIVHTDGYVNFCNTAAVRLIGASSATELIGRSVFDYVPADTRELMYSRIARLSNGESLPTIEFKCLRPDGSCIDVEMQSVFFSFENRSAIQAVIRDVSDRKRAEAALQEANQRAITEYERLVERIAALGQTLGNARDLTTIFRALRDFSVVSVPCDGMIISLYDPERETRKPAYCWTDEKEFDTTDLFEAPVREGLTGRAIRSGSVVIGNDFGRELSSYENAVIIGDCSEGSRPKSALSAPMIVMGRTVGCVEIQSYQHEAFKEEHASAMRMAANLAATAVENVQLIEREQIQEEQLRQSQKMEAVGQLAGGVAHDFNNLLTVISGYSEMALSRLAKDDPLRRNIEQISKAGTRAAGLTRQLLAFSRRQMLQAKVLDLNSVVREMDDMLQRLIGEDVELVTLWKPNLGQIKADPGQLEQVVVNLVVNARDAIPRGGKITIETGHTYLDEVYARQHANVRPGHYVVLSVSDTGAGMDAETQKRIFDPFFTTKGVGKGTGLGLSTVYGIVKQSEGNIWVYSEVGTGTTFKIYLPRVDEVAEADELADVAPAFVGGSETVLLVEDEDLVRNLSIEILKEAGYNVVSAANGVEGLRISKEFEGKIDLMITDVVMPQMSGRELAEHLGQLRPETRVLFMSGYTDDAIVRHGILDDNVAFIQKPFSPDLLAGKAREVLDRVAQ